MRNYILGTAVINEHVPFLLCMHYFTTDDQVITESNSDYRVKSNKEIVLPNTASV